MTAVAAPAHAGRPVVHDRYADLADIRLAIALSAEDDAEDTEDDTGLDPFERTTCYTHRRWLHHCVSSPLHVIVVTGYRWCRRCEREVWVAVDELTGDVSLSCAKCGEMPPGPANRRLVRACRASLAAAAEAKAHPHDEPWTVRSPRRLPSRRHAA
ncbi:hypothetical protein [Actinophytocola sp.]|uniref:hypothetical protein n=1 Tax=Actinophytocola sp. TaxID=1872138 RepID=UPI0025BF9F6A|nr:hypothetical protein [Actinophytocola sp.]